MVLCSTEFSFMYTSSFGLNVICIFVEHRHSPNNLCDSEVVAHHNDICLGDVSCR